MFPVSHFPWIQAPSRDGIHINKIIKSLAGEQQTVSIP